MCAPEGNSESFPREHTLSALLYSKERKINNTYTIIVFHLSPPQRLLFFKKPRKRGKSGKKGKAEKRERRKKRERNGKGKKASARFLSKYGASPGGGCALRCLHMLGCGTKNFKNGVLKF